MNAKKNSVPLPADLPDFLKTQLQEKKIRNLNQLLDKEHQDLLLSCFHASVQVDLFEKAMISKAGTLSPQVALVLLEAGASLPMGEEEDLAINALYGKNIELTLALIDKKYVEVDHEDLRKRNLFTIALTEGHLDAASELLERGADINHRGDLFMMKGCTALHEAASRGSFQGVLFLLENGVDAEIKDTENAFASQMVPQNTNLANNEFFDMEVMFNAMEEYKVAKRAGQEYTIPPAMYEMAYFEHAPTTMNQQFAATLKKRTNVSEELLELAKKIPVPKKGFF